MSSEYSNLPMTAVAMSGGVDSSTVAAILHGEGEPIVGLTMQLWNQRRLPSLHGASGGGHRCCSIDDVYDARRVAEHLGFPYYVINFEQQFEESVVRPFVESYLAGRTPIPCSVCNSELKFERLLTTARQIGAERLATGHYARVRRNSDTGRFELLRAVDETKDQTYFLFGLTQEQLERSIFPLGELTKAEVREIARRCSLPVAGKPESQEICFVPSGDYVQFIEAYVEEQGTARSREAGEIVTTSGKVIGRHRGIHKFTIGQRRGLGVASSQSLYVLELDSAKNRVVVGHDDELCSVESEVRDVNWVSLPALPEPLEVTVKVRHRHEPAAAIVEQTGETGVRVRFREPQRAVTPGQAAVFYRGEQIIGGGWIA